MSSILKWLSVLGAGLLIFFVWTYLPASAHYHIRETYSFQMGDNDAKVRFAVMIPVTGPYQEVRDVAISWNATSVRESHGSVEVVKLEGQIEAHQEKQATIEYDVILHQGIAR